jgi:hypothetical protein
MGISSDGVSHSSDNDDDADVLVMKKYQCIVQD